MSRQNNLKSLKKDCLKFIPSKTMRKYLAELESHYFEPMDLISIVHNSEQPLVEKNEIYRKLLKIDLLSAERSATEALLTQNEQILHAIEQPELGVVYVLKIFMEYAGVYDTYLNAKAYSDPNDYDGPMALEKTLTHNAQVLMHLELDHQFNIIGYENYDTSYKDHTNRYVRVPSPFKLGDLVRKTAPSYDSSFDNFWSRDLFVVVNADLVPEELVDSFEFYDMCLGCVPYAEFGQIKFLDDLTLHHIPLHILHLERIEPEPLTRHKTFNI